jgi:hypothetical protein
MLEKTARNAEKAKFLFYFTAKIGLQAETFISVPGVDTSNGSNRCSRAGSWPRMP